MKRINYYNWMFFLLICSKSYGQTSIQQPWIGSLYGDYYSEKGGEKFIIDNNSFRLIKLKNRMLDASIPNCDTIAKGKWQAFKEGILRLSSDTDFNKINFAINSIKNLSKDTVYIKIILPKDPAFFEGRFKYELSLVGKINSLESNSNLITIAKDKAFYNANDDYHFGLVVQDLYPLNCELNGKCYQRIYFNIFDELKLNSNFNYFTITLNNFNECYVEHINTENELLVIDKNRIYWKGNVYVKRTGNPNSHEVKHLQH